MDPNATLARIRELADENHALTLDDGSELADLILNLDEWLSNGGFLPKGWSLKDA